MLMICLAIAVHDVYMQLRYNIMCMMSCSYNSSVNFGTN